MIMKKIFLAIGLVVLALTGYSQDEVFTEGMTPAEFRAAGNDKFNAHGDSIDSLRVAVNGVVDLPSQDGSSGKYLTTDGTTASWAAVSGEGLGDVSKDGTPVDNQVGVWTGDGTIEGVSWVTASGGTFHVGGNITVDGTVDGVSLAEEVGHALTVATDAVEAVDLKSAGSPTDGQVPTYNSSTGGFDWETASGSGDVAKVNTPANNQVGVWTGDGTIEGDADLTWDEDTLDINGVLDVSGNIVVGGTVDGVNISTMESAVIANTAKVTNATHTGEVTGAAGLTIADNIIEEVNLEVTNSPSDNQILSYDQATGGFTWVDDGGGSGEGTVVTYGTPSANQIAIWTNDDTIKGDADLTFDGTNLTVGGYVDAANQVKTNEINEHSTDAGVTVEGVLIKDGKVDGYDVSAWFEDTVAVEDVVILLADTLPKFSFTIGIGNDADTVAFTVNNVIGATEWDGTHGLTITKVVAVAYGTSPDVDIALLTDPNFRDATPTTVLFEDLTVTSTTTGNSTTTFSDNTITKGDWLWVRVDEATVKPKQLVITIYGYLTD